ncbi:hypothetical protein FQN54_009010 [Arachnomyces sp. PD_36]|nr:hypothetical protein FQN54_009010 [Arachnomyces sp. PD_36]
MLAISEHMKSQGYASPSEEHTRIPGIWRKLGTLYNLAPLDERESYIPDPTDDSDPSKELYCPFELPEDEFGDMMFARRLAPDGFSSPPMSINRSSVRASTVADTDEPRSSPAPTRRGGRTKKPATRTTARGTRSSKLTRQTESTTGDDGEAEDGDEEESEGGDEEEGSARNTQSPGPRGGGRGAAAGRGKKKKGRGGGTGRRGRRL